MKVLESGVGKRSGRGECYLDSEWGDAAGGFEQSAEEDGDGCHFDVFEDGGVAEDVWGLACQWL